MPQRDRPLEFVVVIERRIGGGAFGTCKRRRLVHDRRRRRVPAVDSSGVDNRFECGADLPRSLSRAVELAAFETEPADHRLDLAGAVVDREHRSLDQRRLLQSPGRGMSALVQGDETGFDHVAPGHELCRGRLARPREPLAIDRHLEEAGPKLDRGAVGIRDDGGNDVRFLHRVIPARMSEGLDRVAFGQDVAPGLSKSAAAVEAAEPLIERVVGRLLQLDVERGLDRETVLVQTAWRRTGLRAPCEPLRGSRERRRAEPTARREG